MLEINIVYHHQRGHFGTQRHISFRRQKQIYLILFQCPANTHLKKKIPQNRMSCLRAKHHRMYIVCIHKIRIVTSVEKEVKLMLWMVQHNAFGCFCRKPPYTIQLVFQQQTRIDSYSHCRTVFSITTGK